MKETDAALVLRSLNGDQTAYGDLYDRYAGLVRAICYDTTGDVNEAQDVAQEVFIRAYTKLNKLDKPGSFGAWLVSMAKNVCREYRRGKYRDRHVLVGLAPEDDVPEIVSEQSEHALDLQEAMQKLSKKERTALHVYYLQEQDAEKAQKVLGISRASLFRLLAKAKKNLEKYLNVSPDQESEI